MWPVKFAGQEESIYATGRLEFYQRVPIRHVDGRVWNHPRAPVDIIDVVTIEFCKLLRSQRADNPLPVLVVYVSGSKTPIYMSVMAAWYIGEAVWPLVRTLRCYSKDV